MIDNKFLKTEAEAVLATAQELSKEKNITLSDALMCMLTVKLNDIYMATE